MFYFPYYRSYPIVPVYPYYANYGSYFNAFQSQIGNQSVINTGVANGINQVFSPTAIY